eukprot:CAMPEP_0204526612 /NCGR_PEP_ID=MMETSP0661-20131031/8538_1 /ASSEMBLY_ACC=CAM_ASM_000606 /TAXON_ID=109239 /ORGANISM="Alexandrium margalefi, Strain AMGDE01CS-322" /LENGTH=137 /DNA_ID=CAMNT_0051532467 /DNA_START=92 /DNA_END=501 /DNA_ORIENTATION=-
MVLQKGRRALTRLAVMGYAMHREGAFSLVAVRIATGRRHQIRTHVAHVGHATLCDGKYTASSTHASDRTWCERNFLHRFCLTFSDKTGATSTATSRLPADLCGAARHLSLRGSDVADALALVLSGADVPIWEYWDLS